MDVGQALHTIRALAFGSFDFDGSRPGIQLANDFVAHTVCKAPAAALGWVYRNSCQAWQLWLRRLLRTPPVQDTLQAAIANAYRDFDLYAEGTNFRAWIYRYVTFESLNRNRANGKLAVPFDQRELSELASHHIDHFRWE